MTVANPLKLLEWLCARPKETEWIEFKLNRFDPEHVGEYISGLANSAILCQEDYAYLVFGVENETHEIVGTDVNLRNRLVGGQEFELWLSLHIHPHLQFEIVEIDYIDKRVELIRIVPGYISPVRFRSIAFIRVGTSLTKLLNHPERERAIWFNTSRFSFEMAVAYSHATPENVFELTHASALLKMMGVRKTDKDAVLEHLVMENLILDDRQGGYDITNLLVLLAAKNLANFPQIAKKAPRVIEYKGDNKVTAIDERLGKSGYGVSFVDLLAYIMNKIPHREAIVHGIRTTNYDIPEIAIREILANALIHQDFMSQGDGPLIEIYSNRISITSPGTPLCSTERFIDAPPRSRNEQLAGFMKRLDLCEERGSGIDRAIEAIEKAKLCPPTFMVVEGSTNAVVFKSKIYKDMTKDERIRACYQHACLLHAGGGSMSNATLRNRLGLTDAQYPQASLVIKDAMEAGKIRPLDADQPNRNARYVPAWA